MNLAEFSSSNGDFMVGLNSAQDARDAAQAQYQKALRANADKFFYDCENGRPDQIARVMGERKLTLAGELHDYLDPDALFALLQCALDGEDVSAEAAELISNAADKFADAITEWVEW